MGRRLAGELPLLHQVGVVDGIAERFREHQVVVAFVAIKCPPFGAVCADSSRADVPVAEGH